MTPKLYSPSNIFSFSLISVWFGYESSELEAEHAKRILEEGGISATTSEDKFEDQEIYQRAVQDDRFVLTINFKDFKKLIKKYKSGVITIESQLTNQQIDQKVSVFITDKDPENFKLERLYQEN